MSQMKGAVLIALLGTACSTDSTVARIVGDDGGPSRGGQAGSPAGGGGAASAAGGAIGASGGASSGGMGGMGGIGGLPVAGSGGQPVTGTGGTNAVGAHCTPGAPSTDWTQCHDDAAYDSVSGSGTIFIDGYHLATPAAAGQPYAMSLDIKHDGVPATYEIWGAAKSCGAGKELLWWGDATPGVQCAIFTPTQPYDDVLVAMRALTAGDVGFTPQTVTYCGSAGQCPGGATGHGLASGASLEAPQGAYEFSGGDTGGKEIDFYIGQQGKLFLTTANGLGAEGVATPLPQGLFRMPLGDRFGDAWYCAGTGSALTPRPGGEFDLALRHITAARCPAAGTGTFSVTNSYATGMASVTTSLAGLSSGPADSKRWGCSSIHCTFDYVASPTHHPFLFVTTSADVDHSTSPVTLIENFFANVSSDGSPHQFACGTGGTLTNDPQGTSSASVSGISAWRVCPAAGITGDSFDLHLD